MPMKAQNPELWAAERIIAMLEEGALPPWRKTWTGGGLPQNGSSKREYNGLNRWLLMMAPYASPYFLTFKQIAKLGGKVRKGEKSWPVYFWGSRDGTDAEGNQKRSVFCKGYRVFNIEQTEGIPADKIPTTPEGTEFEHDPIAACEAVSAGYAGAPVVKQGGGRACYSPIRDEVCMPEAKQFEHREHYYSVLFHEYTHSTGHSTRLNRSELTSLTDQYAYSKEELVAEFGAAMLAAQCGIERDTIENSAAYIKGWASRLKSDPEMLVFASRDAGKAVDHILGKTYGKDKD